MFVSGFLCFDFVSANSDEFDIGPGGFRLSKIVNITERPITRLSLTLTDIIYLYLRLHLDNHPKA